MVKYVFANGGRQPAASNILKAATIQPAAAANDDNNALKAWREICDKYNIGIMP
jgi:hypothetical protein